MVLPPFDNSRLTSNLCYSRAMFQLPTSMVAITDSSIKTILQIYFGTHDQPVAEKMAEILISKDAPRKFISPRNDDFQELCSLLVNLRLPLVARKITAHHFTKGYLTDPAELYQFVKDARQNDYQHASLHASDKYFSIDDKVKCYNEIDISFLKKNTIICDN